MQHELFIAVLTGLGGMFGWGLSDLFAKKTIDEIGDVVSLVIAHVFGTLGLIALVIFQVTNHHAIAMPVTLGVWAGLAFFGALQALVYLLVYRGFGKGQVSILNPLFASYSGVVALISILILRESVGPYVLFSLAIIFLGILLLNIDLEALKKRQLNFVQVPGFKEIAIATVLAAGWTLGWDMFVNGRDWLSYAVFMYVFMTITLLLYAWFKQVRLSVRNPRMWKYLVLIGLFEMGAYIFISWGYGATSHTSIVALLSGAFSLPTIVLARLWLKEKTTRLQAIASIVLVIGIMLLAVL